MSSIDSLHSEVSIQVGEKALVDSEKKDDSNIMVSNVAKPTIEYKGYKRTITDVVRIRQNGEKKEEIGISQLMVGLDDAIKICRGLRQRLEKLHKKRNTDFYQQVTKPVSSPQ